MKELIKFVIGDWSGDGHCQKDTYILEIQHDGSMEIKKRLQENEYKIANEYNIHLTFWFADYEDNIIYKDDVEKLDKLKIDYNKNDLNENGELNVYGTNSFLNIWIQLMNLVDPTLTIKKANIDCFYSRCSGYGLFLC